MQLDTHAQGDYRPGATLLKQVGWFFLGSPLVNCSWIPSSLLRVWLLRSFGAKIGQGVRIKPSVKVKFPWRLAIGDHSWIGEGTWIDNLACVSIGSHCCLSQGAYLCTGSHDWQKSSFDLITKPIVIEDHAWIAAKSCVGPGVTVGQGAVLTLCGVAISDLDQWAVYQGNPASKIRDRNRTHEG